MDLELANVTQVRADLIAQQLAPPEQIDAHVAALQTGRLRVAFPPLVSARGREATH